MSHGFTSDKFIRGLQRARIPATPIGYETNLTVGSREGTTVAAHATVANSVGNFVEIFPSTVNNARGVWLHAFDQNISDLNGVNVGMLLSLALGGAGSESIIIPDVNFGNTPVTSTVTGIGRTYYFPGILIPAGSRITLQARSSVAPRTYSCIVALDPMLSVDVSQSTVVAYGSNQAASRGTSVTPANGSFGSWVEIGTTSRAHSIWSVGYDFLADSTVATTAMLIELAYGPNSGSLTSLGTMWIYQSNAERASGPFPPVLYSNAVSTSTKVWARIASGEAEGRGIIIYGV